MTLKKLMDSMLDELHEFGSSNVEEYEEMLSKSDEFNELQLFHTILENLAQFGSQNVHYYEKEAQKLLKHIS